MNIVTKFAISACLLGTLVANPVYAQEVSAPTAEETSVENAAETSTSVTENDIVQIDSEMRYRQMVGKLNAAIKAEKMLIVFRASASKAARGRGRDIKGNMVVGVFRNDFAVRMLDASVDAGFEAPIRFYITELRDGSTRLSYKKPSTVFAPYVANAEPELATIAAELDVIFAAIADRAVK